MISKALLPCT
jgi:hypothetical protein